MKLSEVIKVIEDKTELVFKNYGYTARFDKHLECVMIDLCGVATTVFPLDGWEEVKPPRQWSEKELTLFKLLPDWAKWITRDEGTGNVFVWEGKPLKMTLYKEFNANEKPGTKLNYLNDLFDFLTITFEESPVYIGDLKRE